MRAEALKTTYLNLKSAVKSNTHSLTSTELVQAASKFKQLGRPDWAIKVLEPTQSRFPDDVGFHFLLALSYRDCQEMERACSAIKNASGLAPNNADIAFARAQFAFEAWRPSIAFFRTAYKLAPQNFSLVKNYCIALAAEGRSNRAFKLLKSQLAERPNWIDGHRLWASLCLTLDSGDPNETFETAIEQLPKDLNLQLAWFQQFGQAKNWDRAEDVLKTAADVDPETRALKLSDVYLRAERGDVLSDDDLFGEHAHPSDPGFDICRVRYLLRTGRVSEAQTIAERHLNGTKTNLFLPYLSLCWRLNKDDRFSWLLRDGKYVVERDIEFSDEELKELARTLRSLHRLKNPYAEQSVRGGTQTDRNLLLHPSSIIQHARQKISDSVTQEIAQLPTDDEHPFLGQKPEFIRFSGSWSVKLARQGYHSAHTHILGWMSSALYVSIPSKEKLGPPPAGYLSFGKPPHELNLGLDPYKQIAPAPKKLVLFPSYSWHGTETFEEGERLTLAFDVAPSI